MRYCNVGCSSNSPPKPLHMRLAARLVAVSPSILFVSFGALGFFLYLVFLVFFFAFFLGGLALCSRVGSRSPGFLVGSRSVVRSLPGRLTVSRNLIVRDFRYPRSRAASAAILSVAVIFLAAFCRVGVAVDVRVRDWFCVEC